MNITEFINTLNDIFSKQNSPLDLNTQDFEMAIIENIPNTEVSRWTQDELKRANNSSGILTPNLTSRIGTASNGNSATHFFLSSNSRIMFNPFINNDLDAKYSISYPFKIFEPNLNMMLDFSPNNYYNIDRINSLKTEFSNKGWHNLNLSVKAEAKNRIMFSSKSLVTPFSPDVSNLFYKELRYSLFEKDYLIILKRKKEFNFVLLFLPESIVNSQISTIDSIEGKVIGTPSTQPFKIQNISLIKKGENILIFGAPGTGKSHYIKEKYEKDSEVVRIVFHEEYSYQDFIGFIKPIVSNGQPEYKFSAGPFTKILSLALNNPMQEYSLVIEELNRANAASVFGDIFQLLDRDESGTSEYSIDNDDILNFLNKNSSTQYSEIRIPNNLNILATMNSADQGVFPLDTAFKRRWKFEYIPISFPNKLEKLLIDYYSDLNMKPIKETYQLSVKDFVETINSFLSNNDSLDVNEDRLIGPYFLKEFEWEKWKSEGNYKKIFAYLWEDVARLDRYTIFKKEYSQFNHICHAFEKSNQIFVDSLHEELLEKATKGTI